MHKRPPVYRASSPLERLGVAASAQGYSAGDTWIGERVNGEGRHLTYVNLRMDPSNEALASAVEAVLGFRPGAEPCRVTTAGQGLNALWLGPDEWLVVGDEESGSSLATRLNQAGQEHHISAVNLSSNYGIMRLSGPCSTDILAKMIPMDLHPSEFVVGQVVGTVAAKANVILHKIDEVPTFDLVVRRSFGPYLWSYLLDAGCEFSLKIAGQI